jgi:hypothetical protein
LDLNDLFQDLPDNNMYIHNLQDLRDKLIEIKPRHLKMYDSLSFIHLPSKYNVLTLLPELLDDKDENGLVKYIIHYSNWTVEKEKKREEKAS